MLAMERRKTARFLLIAAFLCLISESNCQYRPAPALPFPSFPALRPLCLSQFALVNHACSMLPYAPVPPPSPPAPLAPPTSPAPEAPCPPTSGHRHRHHHRHRHSNSPDPAVEECCRWLKEVDTQCVCDLLVRLPVFLAKPVHAYTVEVDPNCSVSYRCPGRVIMS